MLRLFIRDMAARSDMALRPLARATAPRPSPSPRPLLAYPRACPRSRSARSRGVAQLRVDHQRSAPEMCRSCELSFWASLGVTDKADDICSLPDPRLPSSADVPATQRRLRIHHSSNGWPPGRPIVSVLGRRSTSKIGVYILLIRRAHDYAHTRAED